SSGGLMCNRTVAAMAAAALVSAASLAAAQGSTTAVPASPAKAAAAKTSDARAWSAPKMPWGHPDISGTWTSDGAIGIPLARPAELAGRVNPPDDGFAKKRGRDATPRRRSDARCGAFCDDTAWLKKSFNQTPLVVEGDGRIPPVTPQ